MSGVRIRVSRTDKGAAKMLGRLLSEGALSVGILAAEGAVVHEAEPGQEASNALTVGEIGEIHEFGLGSAPRRSFLADWADEHTDDFGKVVTAGARALVQGKLSGPLQFLEQVGAWAVGSIQQRMADNIPPPLAPETIKRKGSSVALIDTGQLRSSITYRVDAMETGAAQKAITILERVGASVAGGASNDVG